MAVRFDADGEEYSRTVSLGSVTAHTITCWLKLSADRNVISTAWTLDDTFASFYSMLSTASDGTTIQHDNGSNVHTIGSLTVGTWCYVGLAINGANATAVMQRVGDAAPTVVTWANNQTSVNATRLMIGESLFGTHWLNGCVAAFKFWNGATLSQAELEAEAWTYLPQRTANLRAWYPLLSASTVDYSGNAQTLSGGSGTTTEDGPPISWRSGRRRIFLPSGAPPVDAALAALLPALTASATATVEVVGTLSATLPPVTASLTGVIGLTGELAAQLPAVTASLTGQVDVTATLDAALPALTATLDGEVEANVLEAVLPALTASLTGDVTVTGVLNATLPALTAQIVGETEIPHGDITITSPGPQRGWAAGTPGGNDTTGATARAWRTGTASRSWNADTAARGWAAGQPTT